MDVENGKNRTHTCIVRMVHYSFMYYVLSVSSSVLKTSKDAPCIQMHNTQETFPPFDEAFPLFAQTLCNKMLPMNPFELSKVV